MSGLPNRLFARALLQVYALALFLYPPRFRSQHATQMRIALRDALADPDLARPRLLTTLLHDLAHSVFQENLTMLKESLTRPILLFNALMLAALSRGDDGAGMDHSFSLMRGDDHQHGP